MPNRDVIFLAPYGRKLWSGVLAHLPGLDRIAFDSLDKGDDIARMAEQLLALSPPRFSLVGFCMGGYLAFEILRQAPARVTEVVLINTSARADEGAQRRARLDRIARLQNKVEETEFPDPAYVDHAARWMLSPANFGNPTTAFLAREVLSTVPTHVSLAQQTAMLHRVDSRSLLTRLDIRTLIVSGQADRVTPPSHGHEMAALASRTSFHLYSDCGHLAPLEAPQTLARHINNWLVTT